jgi:hypothetical protein
MMTSRASTIRNESNWRFGLLLAGIAFLIVAFLFLNFRAAASHTEVEKNVMTAGIGEGLPDAMQRREKISLVLVGEGPLIDALQNFILTEMNQAGIGDIDPVQQILTEYQNPVLVVKVEQPDVLWTPLFANSHFTIQAGYSSTGDTTLIGEPPVTVDNRHGAALNMYGEYTIRDRSWGLISRPAYHQSLADSLAREIVASLKELYKVST